MQDSQPSNLGAKLFFLTMWKTRAYIKALALGEVTAPPVIKAVDAHKVFQKAQQLVEHVGELATGTIPPPLVYSPQVRGL